MSRRTPGRLFFQCYVFKDRKVSDALIRRTLDAGYDTLILTADFPVAGKRERDFRTGLLPKQQFNLATKIDIMLHPR